MFATLRPLVVRGQALLIALLCAYGPELAHAQGDGENSIPSGIRRRLEQSKQAVLETNKLLQQVLEEKKKLPGLLPSLQREFQDRLKKMDAHTIKYKERMKDLVNRAKAFVKDMNAYNSKPKRTKAEFNALKAREKKGLQDLIATQERWAKAINPLAKSFLTDLRAGQKAYERVTEFVSKGKFGYDENAPKRLADTAADLADKKKDKYKRNKDGTKCSEFVRDFTKRFVGFDLPEFVDVQGKQFLQANAMYANMKASRNWESLDFQKDRAAAFEKAQELANKGKLVIVAYKDDTGHGHVAVVVPNDQGLGNGGKWGMRVPYIAQAGKDVFAKKELRFGFGPARKEKMEIFVLGPKTTNP